MKDKLITIIFPSRGRINSVERLLLSIEEKTYDKKWIEVIAVCDHDDKKTLDLFHLLSSKISYDFKFVSRKQNKILDLPNDYYDLGLKLASDSYFTWILGNDCELSIDAWDQNLYHALEHSVPDWKTYIENDKKYLYTRINDDTHWDQDGNPLNPYGDKSCCFPILSSNYCKNLGEFYPKEIPSWGADTCLYEILRFHCTKLIELDAIQLVGIVHYSIHNGRAEQDYVSKRVQDVHLNNRFLTSVGELRDPWTLPENFNEMVNKRKKFL